MTKKHQIIEEVSFYLLDGLLTDAKKIIRAKYPFMPPNKERRQYGEYQKTCIFLRDGFIDRYSGQKMVFPPVLRLLSLLMPDEFPFHTNWKMSQTHLAFWELLPTIDHIIPVSRGGPDEESNMVCTSMLRNSAKSNWLLVELGWELHEPGHLTQWDGLIEWFMTYVLENPKILDDNYIRRWHRAAIKALQKTELKSNP